MSDVINELESNDIVDLRLVLRGAVVKSLSRFMYFRHITGNNVGPDYEFLVHVLRAINNGDTLVKIAALRD